MFVRVRCWKCSGEVRNCTRCNGTGEIAEKHDPNYGTHAHIIDSKGRRVYLET